MDTKKFEKDMAAFSLKQHRTVLTYLAQLTAMDWTIEEAKFWIRQENKKLLSQPIVTPKIKLCPDCQTPMQLLPINLTPATLTGEDSKSVWLCSNKECMNTIYNKESIAEIQAARKGG